MDGVKQRLAALTASDRLIPNLMMLALGFQAFKMGEWYMALPDPSNNQAAFVSSFYTLALPAAFKFYLGKVEK